MPGRGPAPKPSEQRRRQNPATHEWQYAEGVGWRHGDIPKPPAKLLKASREAWAIWFGGWFAWFWTPEDIPALRQVVRLYDQVERGNGARASEMRLQMDAYGITPEGQMKRRWKPQREEAGAPGGNIAAPQRWGDLRVVDGA